MRSACDIAINLGRGLPRFPRTHTPDILGHRFRSAPFAPLGRHNEAKLSIVNVMLLHWKHVRRHSARTMHTESITHGEHPRNFAFAYAVSSQQQHIRRHKQDGNYATVNFVSMSNSETFAQLAPSESIKMSVEGSPLSTKDAEVEVDQEGLPAPKKRKTSTLPSYPNAQCLVLPWS